MGVLVIGDSFAATDTPLCRDNKNAWSNVLEKLLKTKIDNYGLGASSLEYAYHMFNRHYDESKHDIVIFVRTTPLRKFLFVRDKTNNRLEKECIVYTINGNTYYDPSASEKNDKRLNYSTIDPSIKKQILKGLFASDMYFPDSQDWKTDAITDSMKLRFKGKTFLTLDMENDLRPIAMIDYMKYNIKHGMTQEGDTRPCHMNIEQNAMLAEYIFQHLKGTFDIREVFKNPEKFFKAAATKKETGIIT